MTLFLSPSGLSARSVVKINRALETFDERFSTSEATCRDIYRRLRWSAGGARTPTTDLRARRVKKKEGPLQPGARTRCTIYAYPACSPNARQEGVTWRFRKMGDIKLNIHPAVSHRGAVTSSLISSRYEKRDRSFFIVREGKGGEGVRK